MAKEFLARILTIGNTVASDGSRDCTICQDKCGTLSPETGIMELEIRLPCNHTVGSACIARWLANNNTCPLCRHEFFPRQPRPYMEHEAMQDTGEDFFSLIQRHPGESDDNYLDRLSRNREHGGDDPRGLALFYSEQLNLDPWASFLALDIAYSAESLTPLLIYSHTSIAAASVYIASSILDQPRNITDIARVAVISEDTVLNVYRAIYVYRYELINQAWSHIVRAADLWEIAEDVLSLAWPPLEHGLTDGESEDEERVAEDDERISSGIGSLQIVKQLCSGFCADDDPNHLVFIMACKVAAKMESMTTDWKTTNPWTIAAACTYMGSHLVFQGKTFEEVSTVTSINAGVIRNIYEVMYGVREQIVQEDWNQPFASWTKPRALTSLPEPDLVRDGR